MQRGDLLDWLRNCQIAYDFALLSWAVAVRVMHLLTQSADVFGLVSTVRKLHVEGTEKCISCQIKIGWMKAQNVIGQRQACEVHLSLSERHQKPPPAASTCYIRRDVCSACEGGTEKKAEKAG
jgi:hypothetical protein